MKQDYQSPTYFTTDFLILRTMDTTAIHRDTNAIRTDSTASSVFWQKALVICNSVEVVLLIFKMVGLLKVFGSMLM